MVIIGSFLAFMVAWGIGANDVANSFATSEQMDSFLTMLFLYCSIDHHLSFAAPIQ
jgi:hypothetical protein